MLDRRELSPTAPPDRRPVPTGTPPALVLRRVPACEPPYERPAREATTTAPPAPARRPPRTPMARPHPNPIIPAALVRAQHVFRLTIEVLEGRRGPQQLQQLMTPELVAKITTLCREYAGRRTRTTARLSRVHVQQVTPRAAEACVTVTRNQRAHAMAARMELGKQGWQCTALRIG